MYKLIILGAVTNVTIYDTECQTIAIPYISGDLGLTIPDRRFGRQPAVGSNCQ